MTSSQTSVIDCDVHLVVPSVDLLKPYLAEHWRTTIRESAFRGPVDSSYPRGATIGGNGIGAKAGERAADIDELREQVFNVNNASLAILTCAYAVESIRNPFAAAALASAVNDWQVDQWLEREPRLRGSVIVPIQDPDLARAEIDRIGHHPAFVQVCLPVRSEALYGARRYYPVYEGALRHDLVIGIQFGGHPGNPPTAVGWPSHYIEEYVGMSQVFQSQLINLITSGVFDRFPTLRVTLLESGVSWLPSLMWRLDKEWKGLRREVPWVRHLPSEYIRKHVRLTMWPFDAPKNSSQTKDIIEQLGSDDLLLFATDFPHQYDNQDEKQFWDHVPREMAMKIKTENARAFYQLSQ